MNKWFFQGAPISGQNHLEQHQAQTKPPKCFYQKPPTSRQNYNTKFKTKLQHATTNHPNFKTQPKIPETLLFLNLKRDLNPLQSLTKATSKPLKTAHLNTNYRSNHQAPQKPTWSTIFKTQPHIILPKTIPKHQLAPLGKNPIFSYEEKIFCKILQRVVRFPTFLQKVILQSVQKHQKNRIKIPPFATNPTELLSHNFIQYRTLK